MTRLAPLALIVLPWPAAAQGGPSFDCRDAGTATEIAICSSDLLSNLEMQMYGLYVDLSGRIGERAARALADDQLAQRQACDGDTSCIARELVATMDAFRAAGAVAAAAPEPAPEPVPEPVPEPEPPEAEVAELPPIAPPAPLEPFPEVIAEQKGTPIPSLDAEDPADIAAAEDELAQDEPSSGEAPIVEAARADDALAAADPTLAAPEPVDVESVAAEPVNVESVDVEPAASEPAAPELVDVELVDVEPVDVEPASAEPASPALADPEPAADATTPLGEAWAALPDWRRVAVQGRLAAAGYHTGPADGAWTLGTEAALRRFFADAIGDGVPVDSQTVEGAAAALDFVDSDAFRTGYMDEEPPALAALTPAAAPAEAPARTPADAPAQAPNGTAAPLPAAPPPSLEW